MRKSKRQCLVKERRRKRDQEFMEHFIQEEIPHMVMDCVTGDFQTEKPIVELAAQSPKRGLSLLVKAYPAWKLYRLLREGRPA